MPVRILGVGLLAFSLLACGATRTEKEKVEEAESSKLDVELLAYGVQRVIQNTAEKVRSRTNDREVRKIMVRWQINSQLYLLRALRRPDPRIAFVDVWTQVSLTRAYITKGRGRGILGELEPLVVDALTRVVEDIEAAAAGILTEDQVRTVSEAIEKYTGEAATEGREIGTSIDPASKDDVVTNVILAVPEGIVAIGSGVKDTAVSISEVASAAEQGVEVLGATPAMMRWQTELLLYTLEENQTIVQLLSNVDEVSDAVTSMSRTAEELPSRVEASVVKVLEEAEASQVEYRKTLAEGRAIVEETRAIIGDTRAIVDRVDPMLARVHENGKWIESAAGRATEAGNAWTGTVQEVQKLVDSFDDPDAPTPAEPSPPFDFKDVVTTAQEATATAESLRASVADLRAMLEGPAANRSVQQIEASTAAAIDRAKGAGIVLILTFFGGLIVYRLIASRLR
ncbi:MAG: hypothetical protein AAGD14_03835 [Planctomycetota bacterium]